MADGSALGKRIYEVIERLYPLCRSITGNGVRQTLEILREVAPIEVHEVPTGTEVLDWTVPNEWNIRDAYIADAEGRRVVDFRESNLHVMNYSVPIHQKISRDELEGHLHSIPEHPDWIPYRTTYYNETWGFCLRHSTREALRDAEYEVCIDSELAPGHLTYGELLVPGESEREVLISTHVCHPSLANDNLSGLTIAAHLAVALAERSNRYSYRFLFIPGTIGSITWLARNQDAVKKIAHGLTLVCLGDTNPYTYKRTLDGDSEIDRVARYVLQNSGEPWEVIDYFPYGYDERQFNSPGFRLSVGSLVRGRHGRFAEYHTSADNLDFITPERLQRSYEICAELLQVLDANRRYQNQSPYGEPQLGRRGLYRAMGGEADPEETQFAMLWLLSLCDGTRSLLDVAERSKIGFAALRRAAELLVKKELLANAD